MSYMHTLGLDMHDAEHFFDLVSNDKNDKDGGLHPVSCRPYVLQCIEAKVFGPGSCGCLGFRATVYLLYRKKLAPSAITSNGLEPCSFP